LGVDGHTGREIGVHPPLVIYAGRAIKASTTKDSHLVKTAVSAVVHVFSRLEYMATPWRQCGFLIVLKTGFKWLRSIFGF